MEQEINNIQETTVETVVYKPETKDLFESYEINKRAITSNFQKIIAGTVVFHILALAVLSQTGFGLGKSRACQNPLMQTVCEVIDMAYVGSVLAGTDRTSVDSAYIKTELEDAEITFIDVTNQPPPFAYPEDYFSVANPESALQETITDSFGNPLGNDTIAGIPGFPNSGNVTSNNTKGFPTGSSLGGLDVNKPSVLPTPNSGTLSGPIPSSSSSFGTNPIPPTKNRKNNSSGFPTTPSTKKTPKTKTLPNDSPGSLGDLGGDETVAIKPKNPREPANNKPSNTIPSQPDIKSDPVEGVKINKKVFEGLLDLAKTVDTTQPFKVVMQATLTEDGKFDITEDKKTGKPKSFFILSEERGDEKIRNLVRTAIKNTGDSGWFGYLKELKVDKIVLTLTQDENKLVASLVSDQPNEKIAGTISSGLKGFINAALLFDEKNIKKLGDDERTLLKGATVTTNGKSFVLNFTLAKDDVQALIKAQIEKDAAKAKNTPQSNKMKEISHMTNFAK